MHFDILNAFVRNCHENLLKPRTKQAIIARDYLSKRAISNDSILEHEIGYVGYKDYIPDEIKFYGKDLDEVAPDNHYGYSGFIKGRILLPVRSEFGDIKGFATRAPSSETGNTWWNLSAPFKKSEHLYLLNKSRKHVFNDNKIYLVEGYIDAIILYQYGLKNVAAIMGTILSPRKIGLIARYCDSICLCLDVDENQAGQKAQTKAIAMLKEFGFAKNISCIKGLPVGEDPDTYVSKNGLDSLLKLEEKISEKEIVRIHKEVRAKMRL
jgi:DNA primase